MFEKDAEEYLKKDGTKAEQIFNMLNEISPLKINIKQLPFVLAMIQQVYQDGVKFGYNKAKEEIQEKKYSSFDFVMKYENEKFKCKYKSGKEFESVDGETWKEIVLPELKESKL